MKVTPFEKVLDSFYGKVGTPRRDEHERIRLSDPKKFSWEMAPCPGATIRDIDSKTLKTAIDEGISKGRIPADAATAKTTVDRLPRSRC